MNIDTFDFLLAFVGLFVGWLIAQYYFTKRKETDCLILGKLEDAGLIEYTRDKEGNLVGKVVEGKVTIQGTSSVSAKWIVIKGREDK
jgi:hypothetical protein